MHIFPMTVEILMGLELFTYAFMRRALIAGSLVGVVCAVVGVFVVLRNLPFIGAGIAHSAFGGVAFGVLVGINPLFSALFFCLLVAWLVGYSTRHGRIKEDVAIGIYFTSTMALGIIFISLIDEYTVDLFGYLFGSILAVTPATLYMTLFLSVCVLGLVILFYKDLIFISFDPEQARVVGVKESFLYYLLLGLIAVTIVASIRVVGILLVSTLLVTPAAAAHQLSRRFNIMMLLAVVFGITATIGGVIISYYVDVPPGATIVLLSTAIFAVSLLLPTK